MEPAPPECGGGVLDGGDTGEFGPGNGHRYLVRPPREGWWGTVGVVRLGWDVSTLLGPEGTSHRWALGPGGVSSGYI